MRYNDAEKTIKSGSDQGLIRPIDENNPALAGFVNSANRWRDSDEWELK